MKLKMFLPAHIILMPLSVCAMAFDDSVAVRKLNLPAVPFNYSQIELPPHFAVAAVTYDNTPSHNPITDHGATLGRVLFYDTRLSANGTVSCASCHKQKLAFTDEKTLSVGFRGKQVTRNSMSLVNARYYRSGRFFWDERAATLEEQTLMPIENSVEMGHSLPRLVKQLQADEIYPPLFQNAFGSSDVSSLRMAQAMAQFIRSIVSYRSKYDVGRAAVGSVNDPFANFTDQENYGKQQFLERGQCAQCHLHDATTSDRTRQSAFFFVNGPAVNGVDGGVGVPDVGVGGRTGVVKDMGAFKASSLRNIELTGPYMHDGRFTTIDRVIEHYNWSVRPHPNLDSRLEEISAQGLALPEREKVALTEFLKTLTDYELINDPKFADPFVR
ncbi:MAG TPA: cytochrome-c peroxidase [Planctomycetes bacterium]|nr:cytochrome-c peroxidase [Fuerstiella sp.]HIK90809.1 cytochrome-c peroxidase [Planctomycetota bacterium]